MITKHEQILKYIERDILKGETQFTQMLKDTILDSFKRLIEPSIDREIRSDLTEKAEEKAAQRAYYALQKKENINGESKKNTP